MERFYAEVLVTLLAYVVAAAPISFGVYAIVHVRLVYQERLKNLLRLFLFLGGFTMGGYLIDMMTQNREALISWLVLK